jgi:hypothetical protein
MDEGPDSTCTTTGRMSVRVSLGSYRLFFAAEGEDVLVRHTSRERMATLRARAVASEEERRRTKWLK